MTTADRLDRPEGGSAPEAAPDRPSAQTVHGAAASVEAPKASVPAASEVVATEAVKAPAASNGKPAEAAPAKPAEAAPAKPAEAAKPKPAEAAKPKPAEAAKPKPAEAAKPKPAAAPAPKPVAPDPDAVAMQAAARAESAAEVARKARRARARGLAFALLLWVGLPTLLGALYYGLVAANQYESVAVVVMAGEGDRATMSATLMREHLLSRDTFSALDREHHIGDHYRKGGDPFSRLSSSAGSEARFRYFVDHVHIRHDPATRVFAVEARAFSGRAAREIAAALVQRGRAFLEHSLPASDAPFLVVAAPAAPEEPTLPHRWYGVLTVCLMSLATFTIGSLLVAAVREHAQF